MDLDEALKRERELYKMMVIEKKSLNREKQAELEAEREKLLGVIRDSKLIKLSMSKIEGRPEANFNKDVRAFLKRLENSNSKKQLIFQNSVMKKYSNS